VRIRREQQVANLVRHDDAQQIADVLVLAGSPRFRRARPALTPACHLKPQSQGHRQAGVE
jgi:hypothetical protein